MKIRDADLQDFKFIPPLLKELGYEPGASLERTFIEILSSSNMGILLAENNKGKVQGFLSWSLKPQLRFEGASLEMDEFVVSAQTRGQGAGALLVKALRERATAWGCSRIIVSTNRDRESYQREFYGKNGFTETNSAILKIQLK